VGVISSDNDTIASQVANPTIKWQTLEPQRKPKPPSLIEQQFQVGKRGDPQYAANPPTSIRDPAQHCISNHTLEDRSPILMNQSRNQIPAIGIMICTPSGQCLRYVMKLLGDWRLECSRHHRVPEWDCTEISYHPARVHSFIFYEFEGGDWRIWVCGPREFVNVLDAMGSWISYSGGADAGDAWLGQYHGTAVSTFGKSERDGSLW